MPLLAKLGKVGFYLALVVLAAVAGILSAALGIPGKWPILVLMTLVTFGIIVRLNRDYWGRWSFWAALVGLFVIHSLAYVSLLRRVERWPSVLFIIVFLVEGGTFNALLGMLFANQDAR